MQVQVQKPLSEPQTVELQSSTVTYQKLAQVLGFKPGTDNPMITVSVDCGRRNSVLATDEMTVVDGQCIEIDW